MLIGIIVSLVAVEVLVLAAWYWRVRRAVEATNRGVLLINQGHFAEGRELFARVVQTQFLPRATRSIAMYNLGVANLWLWDLDAAQTAVEGAVRRASSEALRTMMRGHLTLVAALRGDQREFVARAREVEANDAEQPALWLARAVMSARGGRWNEVLQTLDASRLRPLGGPARSLGEALHAWATQHLGGQPRDVDATGLFGEASAERLRAAWPDFTRFVSEAAGGRPSLPA